MAKMLDLWLILTAILLGLRRCRAEKNKTIAPLSLPPSEYWDGNDGPWSSFGMRVGTPSQDVRLLPGTSATTANALWVVLPQGCTSTDPSNCASIRGFEFTPNTSSTWSTEGLSNGGLYSLSLYEEIMLGYSGAADYGYDNITLGWQGANLPILSHQVIAGIATTDFWIGSLGLSPLGMNFTDFNTPQPSMLGTLRNQSLVPSASWAYSAGAYNHQPATFGSLTLGGYDTTRFVENNVTLPFGADQSRDLLVGLQAISSDAASSPLLSTGVYAFIDSMVPQIWLPVDTCQAFEQAFNLTWNETVELYLLTDEEHNLLLQKNPNITFKVGPSATGGSSVDILFPYSTFDLTVSSPIVDNVTRYFPLKRAENSTQYTLGRTFLQQAYVIADYERHNFSVSQALFPDTSVPPNLVAIEPRGFSSTSGSGLSTAEIVGIVVAVVAFILMLLAISAVVWLRRHRRKQSSAEEEKLDPDTKDHKDPHVQAAELTDTARAELDNVGTVGELDYVDTARKNSGVELPSRFSIAEMPAEDVPLPELEGVLPRSSEKVPEF
ncbi:MAG: hypothetical protein M1827_007455 [Pycnora praestabilis]|nr:MAG: hypothetical protein M1827_007455 [Pycnora praestabilis]